MRALHFILFLFFLGTGFNAFAQPGLMNNKAALVYTAPNSIVKIKGSFNNDQGGTFQNWGTTTIDSSFFNNGLSEKSGFYRVGKDWVNNNIFISDSSQAFLFGNDQFITGDSVTRYWIVELQGTGIKTQQINSFTKFELKLNDRELATDTFYMHVLNTDTGAITRSSGFVSSLGNGKLLRNTNVSEPYLYPTGSSLITTRYRPVTLKPENTNPHTYGVRMVNNDATLDGYDRTRVDSFVCRTNPFFYHLISRNVGAASADIRVFYELPADSLWDGLAHWEFPNPAGEWNDLSPVTYTPATPLSSVTKAAWAEFDPQPFILSRIRPGVPEIVGLDTVCGSKTQLYTGLPENNTYVYNWVIDNGEVTSNPALNEAIVLWDAAGGPGSVTLTVTAQNGCESFPDVMPVLVYPEVVAAFNYSPNGSFGSEPIVFADQSQNANAWNWTFGDNGSSQLQNPTHIYNNEGNYDIMLVATSSDGCKDTALASVSIIEGIKIPNIFTPNDDGVNDLFEVSLSGYENYRCSIFNRWGNLMFETEAPQISWDGTTAAGKLVPAGTYFCVIEFNTPNGLYTHKGTVNVHY